MKLKYVVDEVGGFSIFPEYVNHDSVGLAFKKGRMDIVGAGFVSLFDGEVHCYGESISLNIPSRGLEDSSAIASKLGLKVNN